MTFTLLDQAVLFARLCWDSVFSNPPRRACLQVTQACNLHCKMCTFWQYDGPTPDVDRLKKVVVALDDLGVKHINLWGGEPFLHDDIVDLFRFIADRGIAVATITNGTQLTEDKLRGVVEHLHEITFSIDSPHASVHDGIRGRKGTHETAMRNVERLLELRGSRKHPYLTFDCTILRDNIGHMQEMVEFAGKYGAELVFDPAQLQGYGNRDHHGLVEIEAETRDRVMADLRAMSVAGKPINSVGNMDIIADYLAGREITTPCFYPYVGLLVNPWGEVVYCWGWDETMGNVLDGDFRKRWNERDYRELREQTLSCRMDRCKRCGFSMVRWPDAPGYQVLSTLFGLRRRLGNA